MKPSTTLIKKARILSNQIRVLLKPINIKLSEILEDESAHVVDQDGDGFCVCYGDDQANSCIAFMDIDKALRMTKDELLKALDGAGV